MSKFNFFGNISGQNVSINGEDIINGKHVNNTDSNGEQIDEVRKAPTKIKKLYKCYAITYYHRLELAEDLATKRYNITKDGTLEQIPIKHKEQYEEFSK